MNRIFRILTLMLVVAVMSVGISFAACSGNTDKACSGAVRAPRSFKGDVKDAAEDLEKAQKGGDKTAIAAKAAATLEEVKKYEAKSAAARAELDSALAKADDFNAAGVAKDYIAKLDSFDKDVAEAKAKAEAAAAQ